ncbi:sugar transporter [Haloprofundus marisrubri]|uniref:Sugar transporter n=2 Tax=Haloprofundus marisrubri TaxID=1514971 RepID=A0A0W1R4W2_9EURY|nr:sugar transporter [Haloprofundus marisrubri]
MNRNDRSIVALVMLAHGMVHTYELSVPIFVTIWLLEFETISLGFAQFPVNEATLGLVVTAGYALFGLGALPGGVLVDKLGSRRLITLCLLGMSASFFILGVAPSVLAIAFALVVWGVAASVYHPAGLALISKGVEERGTGFAYHGMAGNIGIGLGPLVAAILLLFVDWRIVATVLAVPALLAALFAYRAEFDENAAVSGAAAETDGGDSKADAGVESWGEFVSESKRLFAGSFVFVFIVVMCSGLYYRGVLTFLPQLLAGLPGVDPVSLSSLIPGDLLASVGLEASGDSQLNPERYIYSGLLMIGVLGQYAGGKLTDSVAPEKGIAGAFGALAVLALVFLPVANLGIGPLLVVAAVLGFALFVVQPLYQATVAEYTPAGTRGLSYGYTYLGVFGIGALGGAIAGAILQYASPGALFVTLAGFAAVASLVGVYLSRNESTV